MLPLAFANDSTILSMLKLFDVVAVFHVLVISHFSSLSPPRASVWCLRSISFLLALANHFTNRCMPKCCFVIPAFHRPRSFRASVHDRFRRKREDITGEAAADVFQSHPGDYIEL